MNAILSNGKPRLLAIAVFALVALMGPGCKLFQRNQPVTVVVRDAETKQPIAAQEVRLSDPLVSPTKNEAGPVGTTGKDGVIQLASAADSMAGIIAEATARGYLFDAAELPHTSAPAKPAGHPAEVCVELFAEPRPTITLVVPNGFHGLIAAEFVARKPRAEDKPGERSFMFPVLYNGKAQLAGPLVLRHATPPDYKAVYADGQPMPPNPTYSDVAFRWVRTSAQTQFFVVGTKEEAEEAGRTLDQEFAIPVRKTGGKSDGGQAGTGSMGQNSNAAPNGIRAK